MRREFHDKTYKHPTCGWRNVFNRVVVYDSATSYGGTYTPIYEIHCFRLWNFEYLRVSFEYFGDEDETF